MVVHMFFLRWKPEATDGDKSRALAEIEAFRRVIPGLLEIVAGTNTSKLGSGYTFGAMMRFADQESLDAYQESAPHIALLQWLAPLVEAVDVDLIEAG